MSWTWTCRKCKGVNTDMTHICANCHAERGSGGGCLKFIVVTVLVAAMAAAAVYHMRKKKSERKTGRPRAVEVRHREKEEE